MNEATIIAQLSSSTWKFKNKTTMKKLIQMMIISMTILIVGCEKDSDENLIVEITTGKNEYVLNDKIDVTIKNNLREQVNHFKCDNVDIKPDKILKYEDGEWIKIHYSIACTQMGSMGYWGVLKIAETKHDTILLFNETGHLKLRYRFIVETDTLDFDSNEFFVYAVED